MKRRSVLCGAVGMLAGTAGCLGFGTQDRSPETNDSGTESDSGGGEEEKDSDSSEEPEDEDEGFEEQCTEEGIIDVFVAVTVPEETTVHDAVEGEFTDIDELARLFERAASAYEEGMESEIEQHEQFEEEHRLAHARSPDLYASHIKDRLNGPEDYGKGEPTYLEYEGVTYVFLYSSNPCYFG